MGASMPLRGGLESSQSRVPFITETMRVDDPPLSTLAPWLYAIDPVALTCDLLAATVIVMTWAGRHFYGRAWKGLRHRTADTNTLIAIGTGAAFIYSVVATFAPHLFVTDGARA